MNSSLKEIYDFFKVLFAVCLAIGLVVFTTAFCIMLAYKMVGLI